MLVGMARDVGVGMASAVVFDEVWLMPPNNQPPNMAATATLVERFFQETGVRTEATRFSEDSVAVGAVPRRVRDAVDKGQAVAAA